MKRLSKKNKKGQGSKSAPETKVQSISVPVPGKPPASSPYAEQINYTLLRIANATNTTHDLDELYTSIHRILGRVINAANFFIALHNRKRDTLSFPFFVDERDSIDSYQPSVFEKISKSRLLTAEVINTGKALFIGKESMLERSRERPIGSISEQWLGVPLRVNGQVIGAMAVQSYQEPNRYTQKDADLLLAVSDQVALAIERKQDLEAIKANEQRYRYLAEKINDIVFSIDEDGYFAGISPSVEAIVGYSEREILGKEETPGGKVPPTGRYAWHRRIWDTSRIAGFAFEEIIHPEDREEVVARIRAAVQTTFSYTIEYRILKKDGRMNWVKEMGVVIINKDARKQLEGVIQDIHIRKRAEEINRVLYSISNAVNTTRNLDELYGSIHFSLSRIIDVSNFFIALYHRDTDSIDFPFFRDEMDHLNSRPPVFDHASRPGSGSLTVRTIQSGKSLLIRKSELLEWLEKNHLTAHGTPAEVWLGVPLKINEEVIGVMTAQNYHDPNHYDERDVELLSSVSEQVALAIERKRAYEALAQSVEKYRQAKEVAEIATRTRSEFLANMSHEIRTPLNAIIGLTDIAMEMKLADEQRQVIQAINHEADHLLELINNVLDFSKIEAGRLEPESIPFDLRSLLDMLAEGSIFRAEQKGLEFFHFMPPEVPAALIGDSARLRQVLGNLIDNALKFTHQGHVLVAVKALAENPEEVALLFEVQDTGIGISEAKQEKIFESFTQADGSTTREYGGTGLGTTIAKRLVELMGGRIGVSSASGQGSTFWFEMGFKKQQFQHAELPVPKDKRKALCIGVHPINQMILQNYLEFLNWTVIKEDTAETSREMIEATTEPELIILESRGAQPDWNLKTKDLHPLARSPNRPVVWLRSKSSAVHETGMENVSIRGSLTKPLKYHELKKFITSVFHITGGQVPSNGPVPPELSDARQGTPEPGKVLVAEDYPTNQQIIKQYLSGGKYTVGVAENGQQAIEALKGESYDLVLMDVQMPVMDGYEATRIIRQLERSAGANRQGVKKRIPIIAMTAHAMQGDKDKCLEAGMDDYISKPFRKKELLAIVGKWIHPA